MGATHKPQKAAFSQKLIEATVQRRTGISSRTRRTPSKRVGDEDIPEAKNHPVSSFLPLSSPLVIVTPSLRRWISGAGRRYEPVRVKSAWVLSYQSQIYRYAWPMFAGYGGF